MSDSGIERTSRQMIEEYARKVHSIDRASDDEKAGRVYGYGRGVLDGLTATHWEDEERFCHLCCAGLESSQHNTDCIGSDNGLAAHDRGVKAGAWDEGYGAGLDYMFLERVTEPEPANPYRIESQEMP